VGIGIEVDASGIGIPASGISVLYRRIFRLPLYIGKK
jgi:hypothetical protein